MLHSCVLLVFTTLLMYCEFSSSKSDPVADICSPLCDEETDLETECARYRGCYDLNVNLDPQVFTDCWTPCWDVAGQCFSLCAENFDAILQQCFNDCRPISRDVSCIASCFKMLFLDIKNLSFSNVSTTNEVFNTSASSFPEVENATRPGQNLTTQIENMGQSTDGYITSITSTPDSTTTETMTEIYNDTQTVELLNINTTSQTILSSTTIQSSIPSFSEVSDPVTTPTYPAEVVTSSTSPPDPVQSSSSPDLVTSSTSPPPLTIRPFSELQMAENTLPERKTTVPAKQTEPLKNTRPNPTTSKVVAINPSLEFKDFKNVYQFSKNFTLDTKPPWSEIPNILESFRQALATRLKINIQERDKSFISDYQPNLAEEVQRNEPSMLEEPLNKVILQVGTEQPLTRTQLKHREEESGTTLKTVHKTTEVRKPPEHILDILLKDSKVVDDNRNDPWFDDN